MVGRLIVNLNNWLVKEVRLDTPIGDREKFPDREISLDRGTLSIIETWPQNTNYLKIEHFSRLVAAELVFPQLPISC